MISRLIAVGRNEHLCRGAITEQVKLSRKRTFTPFFRDQPLSGQIGAAAISREYCQTMKRSRFAPEQLPSRDRVAQPRARR